MDRCIIYVSSLRIHPRDLVGGLAYVESTVYGDDKARNRTGHEQLVVATMIIHPAMLLRTVSLRCVFVSI